MTSCENCDAFVTEQFARVYGDNDGRIHACFECQTKTAVKRGAAADPDFERRAPAGGVRR